MRRGVYELPRGIPFKLICGSRGDTRLSLCLCLCLRRLAILCLCLCLGVKLRNLGRPLRRDLGFALGVPLTNSSQMCSIEGKERLLCVLFSLTNATSRTSATPSVCTASLVSIWNFGKSSTMVCMRPSARLTSAHFASLPMAVMSAAPRHVPLSSEFDDMIIFTHAS